MEGKKERERERGREIEKEEKRKRESARAPGTEGTLPAATRAFHISEAENLNGALETDAVTHKIGLVEELCLRVRACVYLCQHLCGQLNLTSCCFLSPLPPLCAHTTWRLLTLHFFNCHVG